MRRLESLANLLEAAGGRALERAGAILDAQVTEPGADLPPAAPASA